jgi:methionyl-tRNA formyltransferase
LAQIVAASQFEVAYVVLRHDEPDTQLRQQAHRHEVPSYEPKDINASAVLRELAAHEPDLNVSVSYDQILQKQAINMAPRGFINCHAGALPFYRGRNVLNWALINGEDRFGVTVHYVDEGIDSGDIITRRFEAITPSDDYRSLLDKAVRACADVLLAALYSIHEETVTPLPQDEIHPIGFYCSRRRDGDEWIDWKWPTSRIHNLVRAIAPPGPGARTILDGQPLYVLSSEQIPQAPEYIDRPGTVVGRDGGGVVVKTGDTTLKVTRVSDVEGGMADPKIPQYPIGTTFGRNLSQEVRRLSGRVERLEQRIRELEGG